MNDLLDFVVDCKRILLKCVVVPVVASAVAHEWQPLISVSNLMIVPLLHEILEHILAQFSAEVVEQTRAIAVDICHQQHRKSILMDPKGN